MIKITNGTQIKTVTNGAYEAVFEPLGYMPLIEEEVEVKEAVANKAEEAQGPEVEESPSMEAKSEPQTEEEFEEEVKIAWGKEQELKPIASWTKDELKEYSELNEIDTSKAKKVEDVKNIIKEWIANNR